MELSAKRTKAGLKYDGETCRGCDDPIRAGQRIVIEEDVSCAIHSRRYRFWHTDHHPVAVERALNRLRRQVLR